MSARRTAGSEIAATVFLSAWTRDRLRDGSALGFRSVMRSGRDRLCSAPRFLCKNLDTYRRQGCCLARVRYLLRLRFHFHGFFAPAPVLLPDLPAFIDMLLDEIVGDARFGAEGGTGTVLLNQHRS